MNKSYLELLKDILREQKKRLKESEERIMRWSLVPQWALLDIKNTRYYIKMLNKAIKQEKNHITGG